MPKAPIPLSFQKADSAKVAVASPLDNKEMEQLRSRCDALMKINAKLTLDLEAKQEKVVGLFNEVTKLRRSQQNSLNSSAVSLDHSRISELESNISSQTEQLLQSRKKNEDLAGRLETSLKECSKQSQELQQLKSQIEFLKTNF